MNFFNQFVTKAKPYSLELLAMAKDHSETLRQLLARYPKHITTVVAAVLLGGAVVHLPSPTSAPMQPNCL